MGGLDLSISKTLALAPPTPECEHLLSPDLQSYFAKVFIKIQILAVFLTVT